MQNVTNPSYKELKTSSSISVFHQIEWTSKFKSPHPNLARLNLVVCHFLCVQLHSAILKYLEKFSKIFCLN